VKAQERMKRFADKKRTERVFSKGDWVYLRLQPCRQISVSGRKPQKLSSLLRALRGAAKNWPCSLQIEIANKSQNSPCVPCVSAKEEVGEGSINAESGTI